MPKYKVDIADLDYGYPNAQLVFAGDRKEKVISMSQERIPLWLKIKRKKYTKKCLRNMEKK